MTDFQPTNAQGDVIETLVRCIGLSGVNRRPEQGDSIVLDLLPAFETLGGGQPFCVRVSPEGILKRITDKEAGIEGRPIR